MTSTPARLAAALYILAACPAALAQANTKAMEDLAALERTLSRPLPVYPGAKLDFEDATERHCCAFSTRDAVGKVTGFYERTVKATVLDLPGLLKKYPELAKTAALKEQPPGMTLRYVVLAEIAEGGRRAVDAMEVVCAGGTCRFQVASKRLLPADQHFQDEWKAHFAQASATGVTAPVQLAKALPLVDLAGFTREPVQTDEGDLPSVQLRWEKGGGEGSSYVLNLADLKGAQEPLDDHLSTGGTAGFKKVKVNGTWPGVDLLQETGDGTYHAERRFVVHGRYAVELVYDGRGSPAATFDRLCKELKADALPR